MTIIRYLITYCNKILKLQCTLNSQNYTDKKSSLFFVRSMERTSRHCGPIVAIYPLPKEVTKLFFSGRRSIPFFLFLSILIEHSMLHN